MWVESSVSDGCSSSKDSAGATKAASGGHSSLCLDLLKRGEVHINITAIMMRHDRICSCFFFKRAFVHPNVSLFHVFACFVLGQKKIPTRCKSIVARFRCWWVCGDAKFTFHA